MHETSYVDPVTGWQVEESRCTADSGAEFLMLAITDPKTGAVYRRANPLVGYRFDSIAAWIDEIRGQEAESKASSSSVRPGGRHPDPIVRRCQRVLLMVHELHKLGFQRLRIAPGFSPSGAYWRCSVTPASNILSTHGARMKEWEPFAAHYSSSMDAEYFDWKDARQDTARDLARKFVVRFRDVAERAMGQDWVYVGWYVEMLGHAERGALPFAYADWYDEGDGRVLQTTLQDDVPLQMPPGGEAEE
jgi:hypothetical protein